MRQFILCFLLSAFCFSAHAQPTPAAPATQAEVNAGTVRSKFVSPATLAGWTGAAGGGGVGLSVTTNTLVLNAHNTNSASPAMLTVTFAATNASSALMSRVSVFVDQAADGTYEETSASAWTKIESGVNGETRAQITTWLDPGARYVLTNYAWPNANITVLDTRRVNITTNAASAATTTNIAAGVSATVATNVFNSLVTKNTMVGDQMDTVQFYGDSLTSGTGGTAYPFQFSQRLGLRHSNFGVGGAYAAEIFTNQFLPNSNNWNKASVFWLGSNDNGGSSNAIIQAISNIVVRLTTTNYVFLSIVMNTNGNAALDTATIQCNNAISNFVGALHYYDARAALARATNGTAQDATYAASGWTPYSLLADHIHLNTNGYAVVAEGLMHTGFLDLKLPPSKARVMEATQRSTNTIYLNFADALVSTGSTPTHGTMYPDFQSVTTVLGFPIAPAATYATLRYTLPTERLGGKTNVQISMLVALTNATFINWAFQIAGQDQTYATTNSPSYYVESAGMKGSGTGPQVVWVDGAAAAYPLTGGYSGFNLGTGSRPQTNKVFILGFRIRAY